VFVQTLGESPFNERGGGQTSYLLLARGQFGSEHLLVTWVDGALGSRQDTHAHAASEQAYVIVRGRGRMTVDDEEQEVGPGTLVFIPAGASHAIESIGDEPILFLTVTSPPPERPALPAT
jgi:mannose-6-phosphate isomerase-like protein (cupin superfamily)